VLSCFCLILPSATQGMGGAPPPKVMETRWKFSPCLGTNKQKKGICESASTQDKKPQKVADSQTDS
jgi:hypothetical protein